MDRIRTKLLIESSRNFLINLLFLFLTTPLFRSAIGNVILTYPEARYPPLDFLDTERTVGPCGMPRSPRSHVTNFKVGEMYNITWRMQLPHKGGFRVSLLDHIGNIVVDHLSANENAVKGEGNYFVYGLKNQTTEIFSIRFTEECQNCTLLLERQALEWGNTSYWLRSCAEVRVVEKLPEECSGSGKIADEMRCKCEHNRSGPECQYKDDCTNDQDCGHEGKCLQDAIFPNLKTCFCSYGFVGVNCEKRSDPDPDDLHCFAHNGLHIRADADFLYGMFNHRCYKNMTLNEQKDQIYWRVVGTYLEIVLDFETESWVSIGWRPLDLSNLCRLSPSLFAPASRIRVKRQQENPGGGGYDPSGARTNGYAKDAFNAPLHPMDCTDIVMASVKNGTFLHLEDLYTRDRSTPIRDEWLDGEQSITAAYGVERNGRTIVMFRRMIPEIEPTDHPLGPGEMHIIHAKGPSFRNTYNLNPNFYKPDQWKYHGDKNTSRGVLQMEFVSAAEMRQFRGPLIHLDPLTSKEQATFRAPVPSRLRPANNAPPVNSRPGNTAPSRPASNVPTLPEVKPPNEAAAPPELRPENGAAAPPESGPVNTPIQSGSRPAENPAIAPELSSSNGAAPPSELNPQNNPFELRPPANSIPPGIKGLKPASTAGPPGSLSSSTSSSSSPIPTTSTSRSSVFQSSITAQSSNSPAPSSILTTQIPPFQTKLEPSESDPINFNEDNEENSTPEVSIKNGVLSSSTTSHMESSSASSRSDAGSLEDTSSSPSDTGPLEESISTSNSPTPSSSLRPSSGSSASVFSVFSSESRSSNSPASTTSSSTSSSSTTTSPPTQSTSRQSTTTQSTTTQSTTTLGPSETEEPPEGPVRKESAKNGDLNILGESPKLELPVEEPKAPEEAPKPDPVEEEKVPEVDVPEIKSEPDADANAEENNVDKWNQKPSLAESDLLILDEKVVENRSTRTSLVYSLLFIMLSAWIFYFL